MDVDAFVLANRPTWDRLEHLVKNRRRLTGAEVDELVDLYQRVSTHLSIVRSSSSDAVLVGKLSGLVARARAVVTGAHAPLWREFARFWTVSFPVEVYRAWRWWVASGVLFYLVAAVIAVWIAHTPEVQAAIGTPGEIEQLVNHEFANYYSEHPAASFALQVWVNNAWVAAQCIAMAVLLGIPIPYILFQNAANLGVNAGLMFEAGRGDVFLGLITPHGLIELTAVFVAAGVGMRLGWSVVSPGDRPRAQVLAERGRAVISVAIGLVAVLLAAGAIEGFVTPSSLPTFARVAIGVAALAAFLGYVVYFGRRAVAAGQTGDIENAPDVVPTG
ncbi:putative membrane protein SpoIIM required for sporulation [Mycolicibacterium iranicum]|uniref:Putative membrane protein SpoIIM required for sporulation n=1 Tax=Mycolicibacterium iranicum TaxID=912594 RepID=A0A839Q878_MYCIR|nr:stage II sporulation protein M [Mycolicibacterium iranicum]MBB2992200.1 putative membrane protein SpoIIM required for sporulation [Mycolicibacterium iranicum]